MKLPNLQPEDPVEIEWIDSCGRGRWEARQEYERWADTTMVSHWSVGYFLKLTDKAIVIVQSWAKFSDDLESLSDAMAIPLIAVLQVRKLR
jgi:hypothetical protein